VKISAVRLLVVVGVALGAAACSKTGADDAFKNDLTGRPGVVIAPAKPNIPSPAPVARGGIVDDSVKPAPGRLPLTNARAGIADDTIKPAPGAPLPNARGGIADDTIKPAPGAPLPNARPGVPDDSVKPGPGPRVPPK
jgi:hypothetical protein